MIGIGIPLLNNNTNSSNSDDDGDIDDCMHDNDKHDDEQWDNFLLYKITGFKTLSESANVNWC